MLRATRSALLVGFGMALLIAPAAAQAQPANDTLAGATVVTTLPYVTSEDTSTATTDSTDAQVIAACGIPVAVTATVWYDYSATASQTVLVSTSSSSYSSGVGVVTGAPGSFQCSSAFPGSGSFSAVAGQTYHIVIGDISGGNGGTLNLSISPAPPPPTIALTVDPVGRATAAGATITGTVTCTNGTGPSINLQVSQVVGRFNTITGSGFLAPINVSCDGLSHPWTILVTPFAGRFAGGAATVQADGFVSCCASTHVTEKIKLHG